MMTILASDIEILIKSLTENKSCLYVCFPGLDDDENLRRQVIECLKERGYESHLLSSTCYRITDSNAKDICIYPKEERNQIRHIGEIVNVAKNSVSLSFAGWGSLKRIRDYETRKGKIFETIVFQQAPSEGHPRLKGISNLHTDYQKNMVTTQPLHMGLIKYFHHNM